MFTLESVGLAPVRGRFSSTLRDLGTLEGSHLTLQNLFAIDVKNESKSKLLNDEVVHFYGMKLFLCGINCFFIVIKLSIIGVINYMAILLEE